MYVKRREFAVGFGNNISHQFSFYSIFPTTNFGHSFVWIISGIGESLLLEIPLHFYLSFTHFPPFFAQLCYTFTLFPPGLSKHFHTVAGNCSNTNYISYRTNPLIGHNDLKYTFQLYWFYDSVTIPKIPKFSLVSWNGACSLWDVQGSVLRCCKSHMWLQFLNTNGLNMFLPVGLRNSGLLWWECWEDWQIRPILSFIEIIN